MFLFLHGEGEINKRIKKQTSLTLHWFLLQQTRQYDDVGYFSSLYCNKEKITRSLMFWPWNNNNWKGPDWNGSERVSTCSLYFPRSDVTSTPSSGCLVENLNLELFDFCVFMRCIGIICNFGFTLVWSDGTTTLSWQEGNQLNRTNKTLLSSFGHDRIKLKQFFYLKNKFDISLLTRCWPQFVICMKNIQYTRVQVISIREHFFLHRCFRLWTSVSDTRQYRRETPQKNPHQDKI